MLLVGTVQSIWRYPVKSLAAAALDEITIAQDGIPGDRAQALIVRDGHARFGKPYRGKENNLLHTTGDPERAKVIAAKRGVTVDAQSQHPHYFDCAPISLIVDRWLNAASELVGYELEPLRFRPNIFVRAAEHFDLDETSLVGTRLGVGGAVLRVREPIERCVTTTYDVRTGEADPSVLRAITEHRAACLGIYCDVDLSGRIAIGSTVSRQ